MTTINSLYTKNEDGRIHIVSVKDGRFRVTPRTDGQKLPWQVYNSISIDNYSITIEDAKGTFHKYFCKWSTK